MKPLLGILAAIFSNPQKFAAALFAILLIVHWYFAMKEGDFYGIKGQALHWFELAGGIIIIAGMAGGTKYLKPPYLYGYLVFFAVMFAITIGWIDVSWVQGALP